jgi:hypothetical protein
MEQFKDDYSLDLEKQITSFKHSFLNSDLDKLTCNQIEMAIFKRRLELEMKRYEREIKDEVRK